jgi:F-type H+-transporting ATPase subunit delta
MGAQTRQSLEQAKTLLVGHSGMTEDLAANLFAAALGLSGSKALRVALTDSSSEASMRTGLAARAFASLSTDAKKLLNELVGMKWSHPNDLQAALEDLAIRVCASSQKGSVAVGELLAVSTLVHSDPELELALGSKRASGVAKASLIASLVQGKVSSPTAAIVAHLVQDPRGRRIGEMLTTAAETVADQSGQGLAIVTVAKKLSASQRSSIEALLRSRYGRDHFVAEVVNPEVIGGAKIRVGNDVIDGSIQTRLLDLRTKLAG